jgi:hypothetical protein
MLSKRYFELSGVLGAERKRHGAALKGPGHSCQPTVSVWHIYIGQDGEKDIGIGVAKTPEAWVNSQDDKVKTLDCSVRLARDIFHYGMYGQDLDFGDMTNVDGGPMASNEISRVTPLKQKAWTGRAFRAIKPARRVPKRDTESGNKHGFFSQTEKRRVGWAEAKKIHKWKGGSQTFRWIIRPCYSTVDILERRGEMACRIIITCFTFFFPLFFAGFTVAPHLMQQIFPIFSNIFNMFDLFSPLLFHDTLIPGSTPQMNISFLPPLQITLLCDIC